MRRLLSLLVVLASLAPLRRAEPAVVRLTKDADFKQHLQWSPDGKKLLCTRIHKGKMGLWTLNADGSDFKPLMAWTTPHFDGHWAPDSKEIVYVWDTLQGTDGKLQINVI